MAGKTNSGVKSRARIQTGSGVRKKGRTVRYFDYSLFAVMIFLICFGLVMLYSTSSYEAQTKFGDGMYYLKRQAAISAGGILVMLFVSRMNYRKYAKYSPWLFALAMVLMGLVRFSPLGMEVYGSRRWLNIGGQSLQPSEVMKIAVILFIPYLICKMGKKMYTWKGRLTVLAWGAVAAFGVYYLTDNLSTAIIVLGIACIMIFIVDSKTKLYLGLAGGGIVLAVAGSYALGRVLENSTNFRLRRILAWLNPEAYASSGAFQTLQGLYAIGSGGFFGKGLGNSAQKMVIPEAQNDYILAVICEELGVFGAIMVLLVFGLLLYRLLFIAQNASDMYGSLIVTGIFAHIALQVLLNVMVVLNVIPTTGITLPFISYGGTSVLFLMIEMGVALGVSRKIEIE
ncbi:MAG TPA: putative lipid II flippase FtsW [Candidatus Bariatricus faecipullorum]|nr:putative lipid II flippase FtsW [Candidatus Bariatricus faecipullorum]